MSRAPAATATTAPTTSPSTPCCSRARPPGRPVRVQWSREDELAWSPFGAAMAVEIEADLDAAGEIVGWRHDVWSNGHVARPGPRRQPDAARRLAARQAVRRASSRRTRRWRPAAAPSATPSRSTTSRLRDHQPPAADDADPHLGAAHARRLRQRVRDQVLHRRARRRARRGPAGVPPAPSAGPARARRARGWRARAPAGAHGAGARAPARHRLRPLQEHRRLLRGGGGGRGRRPTSACGGWWSPSTSARSINPDGVANQIEGGAIQATSWTLKEAVRFDRTRITSDTWETYPILRFSEVPAVEVEILSRPEERSLGAGEAAHGPPRPRSATPCSMRSACACATCRITRERIIAAMG